MCKFNAAEGRSCVVNVTFFDSRAIHLVPGYFRQTVSVYFTKKKLFEKKRKKGRKGGSFIRNLEKSFAICLSFAEDDSIGEKSAVRQASANRNRNAFRVKARIERSSGLIHRRLSNFPSVFPIRRWEKTGSAVRRRGY